MARKYSKRAESDLKPNPDCPLDREMNILLLGQTGVGKTTFINAFANYIVNGSLEQANADQMQIIIPSSFSFTMPATFDETTITFDDESEHEKFIAVGQSNTQQCESFVFPIGDRNLHLIDTPGIGDTKGLEQDTKNFQEILNYIAQYEHLNGVCTVCKCLWSQHKHITYEYNTSRTRLGSNTTSNTELNQQMTLTDIDKRISDLRAEEKQIEDVYRNLAGFLHANAILPINDEIVTYLEYFTREEQMKQNAGAHNTNVIVGLNQMMNNFKQEMDLLKKTLQDQKNSTNEMDIPKPDEIFTLVGTLYRLPINGQQIREQVNGIKINQDRCGAKLENLVSLPRKAASSKVMIQMKEITSTR